MAWMSRYPTDVLLHYLVDLAYRRTKPMDDATPMRAYEVDAAVEETVLSPELCKPAE